MKTHSSVMILLIIIICILHTGVYYVNAETYMNVCVAQSVSVCEGQQTVTLPCTYVTNAITPDVTTLTWTWLQDAPPNEKSFLVLKKRPNTPQEDGPGYERRVSLKTGKNEASLIITGLQLSDDKRYRCGVSVLDPNGGDKSEDMKVTVKPRNHPDCMTTTGGVYYGNAETYMNVCVAQSVSAREGQQTVTLPCTYVTNAITPDVTTLTWTLLQDAPPNEKSFLVLRKRPNTPQEDGPGYEGRVSMKTGKNEASLIITSLKLSDDKRYRCRVSVLDPNGGDKSEDMKLTVKPANHSDCMTTPGVQAVINGKCMSTHGASAQPSVVSAGDDLTSRFFVLSTAILGFLLALAVVIFSI